MNFKQVPLKVIEMEHLREGIIITFSNGASVIYHAQFLFDAKHMDSNVVVEQAYADGRRNIEH